MKSLTKKVVAIISKVKKKKKSRRKKISKKTMEASLTGECSQFSSTVCSSDPTVPKSSTDASSSPVTMALSYRDALVKPETSVLSAEEGINLKEVFKNIRYNVHSDYGKWINGCLDEHATKGTRIKVLSYNILSQLLLEMHPFLYEEQEKKFLSWEYRSQALLQEFEEFDADILCLQEVEANKLDFFNAKLGDMGYKGVYKKRTGDKEDGCAIYFRSDKFEMKEVVPIEYYQPNVSVLNRDNIGLIARLKLQDNPTKHIVVANTHLLFNPRRQDVRIAQIQIMLAEIERVAYKHRKNNWNVYHPIILTGDFNSRPSSLVYGFLVNGRVHLNGDESIPPFLGISENCQHRDVTWNRYPECRETTDIRYVRLYNSERNKHSPKQCNSPEELSWRRRDEYEQRRYGSNYSYHRLFLKSVHPNLSNEDVSTFQQEWCTVDYIFYGPVRFVNGQKVDHDLKLISYLRLPNSQEATNLKRIPNEVCASDHFPLLATFHLPMQV